MSAREVRSTKLDDGKDPVVLASRIVGLLEGHGWRKTASDQWTSPSDVKATLGYGSGSYRLRFFPPGLKTGQPLERIDLARLSHASRALDAIERWGTWPACGAPICEKVA